MSLLTKSWKGRNRRVLGQGQTRLEHRGLVSGVAAHGDHWHAHVTDANVVYALSHPPRSGAQPAPTVFLCLLGDHPHLFFVLASDPMHSRYANTRSQL